jgi:hypothetical protein
MAMMIKRPGLVIGGVILIALIVLGLYGAAKLAFPIYIAMHRGDIELRLAQNDKRQQDQLDAKNLAAAQASMHPAPPPAELPPVHPAGSRTEDDWLAAGVARQIVSMSEAIRHPYQPLPKST